MIPAATTAEPLSNRASVLAMIDWIRTGRLRSNDGRPEYASAIEDCAVNHRVVGRLVQRMLEEQDACGEDQPIGSLARRQCAIQQQQVHIERVLEDLFSKIRPLASECVVIKGITLYLLTRNPFHIRDTGDRDLLLPNPKLSIALAQKLSLDEYKPPVQHEEINVIFKGESFDFHKHFPVWRQTGQAVETLAFSSRSRIEHTGNTVISTIGYDEIKRHSTPRTILGDFDVLVPGPTMAAFIQIVHLFRDFVRLSVISLQYRPRIRLQELLDISDMVNHPDFDGEAFRALLNTYGAWEQAQFCGSFILSCSGDPRLLQVAEVEPLFDRLDERRAFVLDAWHGFSFVFSREPWEFLLEDQMAPHIVGELGPNRVATFSEPNTVGLDDDGAIIHTHGAVSVFSVTTSIGEEIRVNIEFAGEQMGAGALCAFICVGMQFFHIKVTTADIQNRVTASDGSDVIALSHEIRSDRHVVDFRLTYDPGQQLGNQIEMLVCIGMLRSDGILETGCLAALQGPATVGRKA